MALSSCSFARHKIHGCGRSTRRPQVTRPSCLTVRAAFTLTDASGKATSHSKPSVSVGSSASSDVRISGPTAADQHAVITQKGKQTFLKALVGESVLDDSRTWLDGTQLRPGVSYVLGAGSRLAFGDERQAFTIDFEQAAGSNPLVEMMMKGMVAGSSPEVKKQLGM
ncbi:hypothetical protein HYH02_005885 [Chlamydomonas schloesseri]|uniref:FHA domain-containing protein n=1 Tax=Chlamydomonas schloesseri TaxID=2026947 RepID=A0A836B6L3_9CHLO|nr:hypothetical protein HYH02_005885 [Chlamydomonas schloesseri]|eukprot:KAG2449137.1 hypothetical protein HYH02_005885 [Chlamydomonas schloesseri]